MEQNITKIVGDDESRKLRTLGWLMSVAGSVVQTPEGQRFYITITPDVATVMLGHLAPKQRKEKPGQIKRLVDDLVNGRWGRNGDCIRYNNELWLWDGQHRCFAVIASGVALENYPVLVCEEAQAEMTFDTGLVVRGTNDMVTASGDAFSGVNGPRVAAIVYEHCDFIQQRVNNLSKLARLEIARNSPFLETVKLMPHRVGLGFLAAFIRCARTDEGAALDWFNGALSGDPVIRGEYSKAAQMLHRWMLESRGGRAGQAYTLEQVHRSIKLFNYWRTGKESGLKQMPKYAPGYDLPKVK